MMSRFAAGGDSARDAFFEVVNALEGMDDPMSKNKAAVALFGTMYEDLESMPASPPPVRNSSPATKPRWTTTPASFSPSRSGSS